MKKLKKPLLEKNKFDLFKPEVRSSRLTISSRICNQDKFNDLFQLVNHVKDYKNLISLYCYDNLTLLISTYSDFLTHYKLSFFDNNQLNSWESQTIYQEIAGHYYETAKRYLSKAKYVSNNGQSSLVLMAKFIDKQSHIELIKQKPVSLTVKPKHQLKQYELNFSISELLIQLQTYLTHHQFDLSKLEKTETTKLTEKELQAHIKQQEKLNRTIKKYNSLIEQTNQIELFSKTKPELYHRLINLVLTKKLRLISKVKLGQYQTGTHARHLDNAQLSIVKDLTNKEYQYFLKVRKHNKLISREPKLKVGKEQEYKDKLTQFNEDNFIYLPLTFNKSKLKEINKTLDTILTSEQPQILIKAEQIRLNSSSQKIHLIFNYKQMNNLANFINTSLANKTSIIPTEQNTVGADVNLKHNLIADSTGTSYSDILKETHGLNKNKFIENVNEIVLLHAINPTERTEKETYRYEKLLRSNEGLMKTYLSGIVTDWKNKGFLHIVLEDLNFLSDSSYYKHKDVKIKYTRLSRLLRVGQIKHWIASRAEKEGLFCHWINPAYTSQECSVCHHINTKNRPDQETFCCKNKNCPKHNVIKNADFNSTTIKYRFINPELRNELGKDNVYLCHRSKAIYYKNVKPIVEKYYGVVTELLPNSIKRVKKEAPSL